MRDFYPRPPRGGRHFATSGRRTRMLFLSTPSARRATRPPEGWSQQQPISIHALREEGDVSAAGCTRQRIYFYPRPPRGGRPAVRLNIIGAVGISIHALREEGDGGAIEMPYELLLFLSTPSARRATEPPRLVKRHLLISIHALREEGDARPQGLPRAACISIHALREEGDASVKASSQISNYFYPRPPRGGRLRVPV